MTKVKQVVDNGKTSFSSKRHVLWTVLVAVAAGGLLQMFRLVRRAVNESFQLVDVANPAQLRDVFFGGEAWLLHCLYPSPMSTKESPVKLLPLIDYNRGALCQHVRLGTIDCTAFLPSGKTIVDRFALQTGVVAFVVANGERPRGLTAWALEDISKLVEFVKSAVKPTVYTVTNDRDMRQRCYKRRGRCVVFGQRGGVTDAFRQKYLPGVLEKDRQLNVVHVDTAKYSVKLDDRLAATKHGDAVMQVLCVVERHKDEYYGMFFKGDIQKPSELVSFFHSCRLPTQASGGLDPFGLPPPERLQFAPSVKPRESHKPKDMGEHKTKKRTDNGGRREGRRKEEDKKSISDESDGGTTEDVSRQDDSVVKMEDDFEEIEI